MDVSEAKRLRQLEEENAKLKRLVADLSLDNCQRRVKSGTPALLVNRSVFPDWK
jgi:putative transposase